MKKIYSFEDFQDSTVYLNNSPSKFITRSLIILFIIFMAVIISIFFIKKTDYIKSTAVITPKNNPINITTDKDIKVKKLLKDNGELVQQKEKVITIQDINNDKKQITSKIKYKKESLKDLSLLYDKIDNYPLESDKKLHTDYSEKYFESYKKQYNQTDYLDNSQRNNIKSQSLQILIEKINTLKDELHELSVIKGNDNQDYVTKNGYIFYPKEVQEGLIIPKGKLLYQIYKNRDKEVVTYISSEDILSLNPNQKVSITFKTKKDEFYLQGNIKYISKFPEESKNNETFYKVKISLKDKIPKQLENVYYLKGTSYVELEKETIAQYLYRKIKE
ncbi:MULTISPECIES: HlyD family efflux transporter periplasmic adaptor subunit [Staphylococcus]|uniref:Possible periplasmic component of efflux system n=2 Tax=Staphylococcus aureus TaxID=1280 RepID=A1KWU5_STAAU|nr:MULTISPECIES: HlyD family secretion protein [Staphylococcus]EUJ68493.1 hypothetical protein U083_02677 [Staphylococcus aureus DAR3165]KAA2215728.1 HlyD family efflux transporter periplasmic adaptor subunit [Staphylococcus sp. 53017]KAA2226782.1 HlyD family efflux transporter periplasmic adaptor subunit [Staphylococcus sp. 52717]KAA2245989.1 HlyD family efflux transporter periplasmic adaptor subunit [Staphylococcus sp. 52716]KAA2246779.1 HlyD family efflux transporter periplasmic adaptor sub